MDANKSTPSVAPTQNVASTGFSSGFSGSNQVVDLLIGNLLATRLSEVMRSDFQLSLTNISKLLILMSVSELKNYTHVVINYLTTQLITLVKKSPILAWPLVMKINQIRYRRQPLPLYPVVPVIPKIVEKTVEMVVDPQFRIALYNYLTTNSKCTFTKTLDQIDLRNAKENIFTEKISNIRIKRKLHELRIEKKLLVDVNIVTGGPIEIKVENHAVKPNNIKTYTDLFDPEQAKIIIDIRDKWFVDRLDVSRFNQICTGLGGWKYEDYRDNIFSERMITEMICKHYPQFDKYQTMIEIIILSLILYKTFNSSIDRTMTGIRANKKMIYDPFHSYELKPDIPNQFMSAIPKINSCIINQSYYANISNAIFRAKFSKLNKKIHALADGEVPREESSPESIPITISSPSDFNENTIMQSFISKIYKSYKKSNDRVKVFYLNLEEKITATEVANPAYGEWEEKKKLIESIKGNNNSNSNNNSSFPVEVISFLSQTIPSKTIKTEKREKIVVSKQLNEIEKDIDTLFLKEFDKRKLMNSLTQFKTKSHILKELGLQNKLNILLHGIPGTGKSSTIQAVATYLNRDIYYVDLQKAELNEDVQLMFNYVNCHVPNSGIVVIEDIDAMTDVVLKRTKERVEYRVNELINNQKSKLSLEYFLNILQGTLTMDGSIFAITTNHIEMLDPAFYRDGRFDVKIELGLSDHFQIRSIYKRMMGRDIPPSLLKRIPEGKFSPATLIYHIKNYIFDSTVTDEEILSPFLLS